MVVAISADMEGVSQLGDVREILACCPEYWERGKPRLEADVKAACEGILAAGASEVVVLDNHASGNTFNIWPGSLPDGARLEQWNVFELGDRGVDAFFQVGYHARGGVDGFLSHTYVPGLRLRLGEELLSESHGRAWAARLPLLGIVGNETHAQTLGSLAGVPFLVVQESRGRASMTPTFTAPQEGLEAIRDFTTRCVRGGSKEPVAPPKGGTFAASMPNGGEVADQMQAGGWTRVGDVEFAVELEKWKDAQDPLAVAMGAAFSPYMPDWLNELATRNEAEAADGGKAKRLSAQVAEWAQREEPEWFTTAP
jgi:D-aminopeptidase